MDDANPFEAPRAGVAPRPVEVGRLGWPAVRRVLWWVTVFVANLPVPLLLGTSMTDRAGLMGLAVAVVAMMAAGAVACARARRLGLALIVGGAAVGLSQVVPILQVVAGSIGMRAGDVLGVVDMADEIGKAVGLVGGAFVTTVTGSLLIAAAGAIGVTLQVVTPGRWWGFRPEPSPLD